MSTLTHKQITRLQQSTPAKYYTEEQAALYAKLLDLKAHFAKPTTKAEYPTKEFSNTTITLWLTEAGKGKAGDRRYSRSNTKRGGKGVFVSRAHLNKVCDCEEGGAMYVMPLAAALNYGLIYGEGPREW